MFSVFSVFFVFQSFCFGFLHVRATPAVNFHRMPELPEVETVARGLRLALPGRRIVSVRLSAKTNFIEDPSALELHLPGSRVSAVRRHGKVLLVDLDARDETSESLSLQIHLGMTGQIVVGSPDRPVAAHTHVFLALDDGRELRYTDVRRFGKMRILAAGERVGMASKLGTDSLSITADEFGERIHARRSRIKALLLNQSVLSGMGNIYTDESLWRAKINPKRLGANLKPAELSRLYKEVRAVLHEAIKRKGSSISDYVDADGNRGDFQSRHRVYQRKGKPCFRCRTKIKHATVAGRSTFYCPRCQPDPRIRAQRR
jgi:formamidopyrimidine-DNA glycosylase